MRLLRRASIVGLVVSIVCATAVSASASPSARSVLPTVDSTIRFGVASSGSQSKGRRPTAAVVAYRALVADRGVPTGYRPTRAPVACSFVDVPQSCSTPAVIR